MLAIMGLTLSTGLSAYAQEQDTSIPAPPPDEKKSASEEGTVMMMAADTLYLQLPGEPGTTPRLKTFKIDDKTPKEVKDFLAPESLSSETRVRVTYETTSAGLRVIRGIELLGESPAP
ncbi:MAG: hypothetical protein EOO71_29350, partial [Myxococcaceae bacterium]